MSVLTLTDQASDENSAIGVHDEVELQIQEVLAILEKMAPEAQTRFCGRLLGAIAERLSTGTVTKAVIASKAPPELNPKTSKKPTNKGGKNTIKTHLESRLTVLSDSSDPVEAWHYFGGAESLYQVLREESEGRLLVMLQHRNMPSGKEPRGKTSDALAKNIVQRLSEYFGR